MGIKAKADFPDRVRDVTSYEGMQRRSEQGRNDKVGRLLAGMDRVTITDGKGKRIDVIGRRSGNGPITPPISFSVTEAPNETPNSVSVAPGVITGLNPYFITPLLNGEELIVDPPPFVVLNSGQWALIRLEIEPVAAGPAGLYYISEDDYEVVSCDIIATDSTEEAQMAEVNSETGAVTNGIYLIPLAVRTAAGVISQTMYGPLSAKFCNGRLTITAPSVLQIVPII